MDNNRASPSGRATAVEPVPVSPLRDGIPDAKQPYNCSRCESPTKWNGLCTDCMLAEFEGDDDELLCEDGEFDDCGLMPNGQCLKAGSEECDWECGRLHQ